VAGVVGSASIRIIPDTSAFSAQLRSQIGNLSGSIGAMGSRNITGGLSTQLNTLGNSLDRAGTRAALVGQAFTHGLTRPLLDLGRAALAASGDFDEAARTVAAVTLPGQDETLEQFEGRVQEYKDLAREVARDTTFSSTEIQQAFVDLTRAGLTSGDQLRSVISTVSNIALVEGGNIEDFSEKMVEIFTGFGGSFEEMGGDVHTIFGEIRADTDDLAAEFEQMADVLTLTSQRTVTDITDLATAFSFAGPVASKVGLSFEETAAALGILAQTGVNASRGGTALRNIITRLAIPTKVSQEIFDKFGLSVDEAFTPENIGKLEEQLRSVGASQEEINEIIGAGADEFNAMQAVAERYATDLFDAEGNMIPLIEVVRKFNDEGARTGDVMKLFGQRAGPAFLGLMDSADALEDLTRDLDGADGSLAIMAERMRSSANVQFKLLKNSITEVAIAVGESGLLEFFSDMAKRLADFLLGLADTSPEVFKWVAALGAMVAAIGPLGIVFGLMQQAMGNWLKLLAFGLTPVGAFVLAVGTLTAGLAFLAARSEPLREALGHLFDTIQNLVGPFEILGKQIFNAFSGEAGEAIGGLTTQVTEFFNELTLGINEWVSTGGLARLVIDIIDVFEALRDLWTRAKPALTQAFTEIGEVASTAFDLVHEIVGEVAEGLANMARAVLPVLTAAWLAAWEAAGVFLNVLDATLGFLIPVADIISDVLGPALLGMAQLFLLARGNGFKFLETFRQFRAEIKLTDGKVLESKGRMASFFGTLSAGFKKLREGSGAGVGLGAAIGNVFSDLTRAAAAVVQPFANALGDILKAVGGFLSRFDATLRNGGISGLIKRNIGDPLLRGMVAIQSTFIAASARLGDAINRGLIAAITFATVSLPAVMSKLASALSDGLLRAFLRSSSIASQMGQALSGAINRALSFLTNLNSGAITEALNRVILGARLNVAAIATMVGDALRDAFLSASTRAMTAVTTLMNNVRNGVRDGWLRAGIFLTSTVPNAFRDAFTKARTVAAGIMDAVVLNVTVAWQNMRDRLQSIDIGGAISRAADALKQLPIKMREAATQMGTSGSSIGTMFSNLWERVKTGASNAFTSMKNIISTSMQAVGAAMQVAGQIGIGFMQGLMIAEATDLRGKLSALIPVIVSIGTTMAMAFQIIDGVLKTSPVFAIIAAFQSLAVLAGTVLGKVSDEAEAATDSINAFRDALAMQEELDQQQAALDEIIRAFDEIGSVEEGQTGFVTVKNSMANAGIEMHKFVEALVLGDEATQEFIAGWREADISRAIGAGEFSIEELTDGTFMLTNANGALINTYDSMAEARERVGEAFDERFDVERVKNIATQFQTGRVSLEEYREVLEGLGVTEEQAAEITGELEEEVLSLGGAWDAVTSAMDTFFNELESRLDGFDPAREFRAAKDDFIDTVDGLGGALERLAGEGGTLDFSVPGFEENTEHAREMRDQVDGLSEAFRDQVLALGAGSQSAEGYALGVLALRQQFIDLLVDQGATIAEAEALAGAAIDLSGVKELSYDADFAELATGLDDMQVKAEVLNETLADSEGRYLAELAIEYPGLDPEVALMFAGGVNALRREELEALGIEGGLPTIQVPGEVVIAADATAGLPSHGIPSQVAVKITFEAVENMDAALTEIQGWADSIQALLVEVATGAVLVGMAVVNTVINSMQAILAIPQLLTGVAQGAASTLLGIAGGVGTIMVAVVDGLGAIPIAAMDALVRTIALFSNFATGIFAEVQRMTSGVIAQMGSMIQFIMLSFSALSSSVARLIDSLSSNFLSASSVIIGAINRIVAALNQIPVVMAGVSRALTHGFSEPFSKIASQVWNPFARFINSASTAVGLGNILPTGLSIPVFHDGGIVGNPTGDSFNPARDSMGSAEVLALLQRGEGVMTQEMMASMTSAQLSAFESGNKRWWAVGGPYEDGGAGAAGRVASGHDPLADLIDYQELVDTYNTNIRPMIDGVAGAFPNNQIAAVASASMNQVGEATLEYARGYADEIGKARAQAIGLPSGYDLAGTVPAGFDIPGWRAVLGANRGKSGNWPLLAAYLNATGIPHIITSTFRPGSITATGNLSNHALGRAIDVIGPSGGVDTPEMLRINHAFAPVMDLLSELIYSGPGSIQTQAYTGITRDMHHNHVHAALRDGGLVKDLVFAMLGEAGPELVLPMNDPVRALSLARQHNLMGVLAQAQNSGQRGATRGSVDASGATGGPLGGGPGNTYHIHGQSAREVETKIRNRDRASMRKRR
jgi:TP901 family phage tail tape measure protein